VSHLWEEAGALVGSVACLNCAGVEVGCEAEGSGEEESEIGASDCGCAAEAAEEELASDVLEEFASDLDCGVGLGCGVWGGLVCGVLEVGGCDASTSFCAWGVSALEVSGVWRSCDAFEMDCGAYSEDYFAGLCPPRSASHQPTFRR